LGKRIVSAIRKYIRVSCGRFEKGGPKGISFDSRPFSDKHGRHRAKKPGDPRLAALGRAQEREQQKREKGLGGNPSKLGMVKIRENPGRIFTAEERLFQDGKRG